MALWSEGKVDQSDSEGESEGERVNDEEKEEDENEHNEDASTGWAEAMAKILGKKTMSGILEKNKELEKMKAAERQEQLERKKQVSAESQAQDDVSEQMFITLHSPSTVSTFVHHCRQEMTTFDL